MDRFMGMETMGYTEGILDSTSAATEQRGDQALKQGDWVKAMDLLLQASIPCSSPANCDAACGLCTLLNAPGTNLMPKIKAVHQAGIERLKKVFGPKFFLSEAEGGAAGSFWSRLDTRPWMRLNASLAAMLYIKGESDRAAELVIESLRLCPGDNLGLRTKLVPYLLRAKRPMDAIKFCLNWIINCDEDYCCPPIGGCDFSSKAFPNPIDFELTTPEGKRYRAGIEKDVKSVGSADKFYDLALAAFMVKGDCELGRVALDAGARTNPIILRKIVGKDPVPKHPNREPRAANGPEDAQDYLWASQAYWNDPKVFKCIKPASAAVQNALLKCSNGCGKAELKPKDFKRCAACKKAVYCSTECQTAHWKEHKAPCRKEKDFLKNYGDIKRFTMDSYSNEKGQKTRVFSEK